MLAKNKDVTPSTMRSYCWAVAHEMRRSTVKATDCLPLTEWTPGRLDRVSRYMRLRADVRCLLRRARITTSSIEKVDMYLDGWTQKEVSEHYGQNPRTFEVLLGEIRKKIKEMDDGQEH